MEAVPKTELTSTRKPRPILFKSFESFSLRNWKLPVCSIISQKIHLECKYNHRYEMMKVLFQRSIPSIRHRSTSSRFHPYYWLYVRIDGLKREENGRDGPEPITTSARTVYQLKLIMGSISVVYFMDAARVCNRCVWNVGGWARRWGSSVFCNVRI